MTPETFPQETRPEELSQETVETTENVDSDFEKTKEMELIYREKCATGSDRERDGKYEKRLRFTNELQAEYEDAELQKIFLYHVLIGGSLSSSIRDGFPMKMQYDTPDGAIEKFILSL